FDDRADGRDRLVEALGDLAVGGLERTRARRRGVEFAGKPRAVGIEGMNLRGKCGVSPVAFEPALHRALERVERRLEALGRHLDHRCITHVTHSAPSIAAIAGYRALQNRWRGKMLQKELYVRRRASVNVADRVFNACAIPLADCARMHRFRVWMAPAASPRALLTRAPRMLSVRRPRPAPPAIRGAQPGQHTIDRI